MGILDAPGLTRQQGDARYATQAVADLIAGRFPEQKTQKVFGPLTTDVPVVTISATPDGTTYNKSYSLAANSFPSDWPMDMGGTLGLFSNGAYYSDNGDGTGIGAGQPRTLRVMMDGSKFCMSTTGGGGPAINAFYLFVNGAPFSLTPIEFGTALTTIVFPTAKPRLLEFITEAAIKILYTQNPYRLWKPPPVSGQRVLLVGDSYSSGITMNGSDTTQSSKTNGFAATLGLHLGVNDFILDGAGGTGYILENPQNTGNNSYVQRLPQHIAYNPDVLIIGGGGANDMFYGESDSDILAAAISYFTQARTALPNTKLVFLEGFAPPQFKIAIPTISTRYTNLRIGLQAALGSVGVYYIDVATSAAWLDGTGRVGATTGVGNSDLYVGGDGTHLTKAGHAYIRERLSPKIRAVMSDNGALLNTLI